MQLDTETAKIMVRNSELEARNGQLMAAMREADTANCSKRVASAVLVGMGLTF